MTALTADTAARSFRRIAVRVVGMLAALGIALVACPMTRAGHRTRRPAPSWVRRWVAWWAVSPSVRSAASSARADRWPGRQPRRQGPGRPGAPSPRRGDAECLRLRDQRADHLHGRADQDVVLFVDVGAADHRGRQAGRAGQHARRWQHLPAIELTATKNGQTTTETTTFCKSAGSQELKPVSV
jgi:hypothetical protein